MTRTDWIKHGLLCEKEIYNNRNICRAFNSNVAECDFDWTCEVIFLFMETYINSLNKWEKRKEKRASRSKGIKGNWCCRPAAACNETACKSAWLPAWLLAWLCVGGTFLLLIVVPLYFSSHLCHFSFSSNHSLPIINVHIFCPHWSAIVAIYLRQLHKQIVDNTHLWRGSTIGKVAWLQFIVKRELPPQCRAVVLPFLWWCIHTSNCLVQFDGLWMDEHCMYGCNDLADCPAMSFVFVCWHSRKWWPPIRGGTL